MPATVLQGTPQRLSFFRILWLFIKRRKNYLHVFVTVDGSGEILNAQPCIGPYEWPEAKTTKAMRR